MNQRIAEARRRAIETSAAADAAHQIALAALEEYQRLVCQAVDDLAGRADEILPTEDWRSN